MYELPTGNTPLSQGDILDDCPLHTLDFGASAPDLAAPAIGWRVRVVVLTQACDLVQGRCQRIVVAEVHTAQELVDEGLLRPAMIRDQIRLHKVYGWYFLPAAPAAMGFPESLVDLRDLHTLPLPALTFLVSQGKRVCRISTPWREHLAQHFSVTYSRIALPEPYETQP